MSRYRNERYSNEEGPVRNTRRQFQRKTNLYVKNFDQEMTESGLCNLFASYGTITSCNIATDRYNQSKGFGFVDFETESMAENALKNLNGYLLKSGKKLYVNYFQNKDTRQQELKQTYYQTCQNRNLYISNLSININDEKLKDAFNEYGIIRSAKVMIKNGQSKGYGFVCFSTETEALDAIKHMNGKELGTKPIYVALCKGSEQSLQTTDNESVPAETENIQQLHSTNVCNNNSGQPVRQAKPVYRLSNRLPKRLYGPFPEEQTDINNNEYFRTSSAGTMSTPSTQNNGNTSSNDEHDDD